MGSSIRFVSLGQKFKLKVLVMFMEKLAKSNQLRSMKLVHLLKHSVSLNAVFFLNSISIQLINIPIIFRLDNVSGKVKVRFSHVPDGFLVQTDQVDIKIKHEKGIVKLYDRANNRRILSKHIPHI